MDCPHCLAAMNRTTTDDCRAMRPGDLAVCTKCGEVSCFDATMDLRPLLEDEWGALSQDILTRLDMLKRTIQTKRPTSAAEHHAFPKGRW